MWIKNLRNGLFLTLNPKKSISCMGYVAKRRTGRDIHWQIKGDVPYQIETARKLPKRKRISSSHH